MKKKMTYFNYEERNGIFLLTFILLLFCCFIFLQKRVLPQEATLTITHNSGVKSAYFEASRTAKTDDKTFTSTSERTQIVKRFDKNEANKSKQVNHRKKTNHQSKKKVSRAGTEESKKLRSSVEQNSLEKMNEESLSLMQTEKEPRAKKSSPKKFYKAYKKRKKTEAFSINSQDQDEWESLYGIGPKYAERILKYQRWLGGFHSKDQLKEVYGINDTLYQSISEYLLEAEPYKLIKINHTVIEELGKHPYIYWKEAKRILKYRKHHGDFRSIEDLKNIKGLDMEQVEKLLPYLDFASTIEVVVSSEIPEVK